MKLNKDVGILVLYAFSIHYNIVEDGKIDKFDTNYSTCAMDQAHVSVYG